MDENKNKNAIVIFAKEPDGKSAKTRIASTVGKIKAAEIYNELLGITSDIASRYTYYVSFSSYTKPSKLKDVFNNAVSFIPQINGDLGERMRDSFNKLFEFGYESVIAIGTDCPYITLNDLNKSIEYLNNSNRVVLGPATDGGYYLIGCRKETLSVLNAKMWSTSELFEETLSIINKKQYDYLALDKKDDIDEIEDYNKFKERKNG